MSQAIRNIVIVGGGTAGWITAGLLARHYHPLTKSGLRITLVEASDVPIIGVGEGTWPTMRRTLQKIGISEIDLLKHCHATFKQGSRFNQWKNDGAQNHYIHPFNPPIQSQPELSAYWCAQPQQPFAESLDVQATLGELGLAPKTVDMPEYAAILNYGYHFDAGVIAELIKQHCIANLGVEHRIGTVSEVQQSDNGDIKAVVTRQSGTQQGSSQQGDTLKGDLFVDCSGFSALLIGQTLNIETHKVDHILFADRALAVQVPHENSTINPSCFTQSTAQSSGWIWDIGLSHRRGVGYVYSRHHIDREHAEQELANYVGDRYPQLSVRELPINSGYRKKFWQGNCVAVGLSAGFIEPLEASALMLIELSANMICERLPANREAMNLVAKQFNQAFEQRWQRIIEFLKLHYCLSQRQGDFWEDNRRTESIPERLQQLLKLWRHQVPSGYDFPSNNEVFSWASYQYVLYGMGSPTEVTKERLVHTAFYQQLQQKRADKLTQLKQALPRHRDYLNLKV